MKSLTRLQRTVITTTAVLSWGGFWIGAALATPGRLTIDHEPPTTQTPQTGLCATQTAEHTTAGVPGCRNTHRPTQRHGEESEQ